MKIPQETLSLVLNLKDGLPAPMVKIDKSYYVYALKEKKPGRIPELSEVKNKIKEAIIQGEIRKNSAE